MTIDQIREALQRAIDSPKGIRIPFDSESEATTFRHRCNSFRVSERKASQQLYPMSHPLHGVSEYDGLVLSIEGSTVVIKKLGELKIEEIE